MDAFAYLKHKTIKSIKIKSAPPRSGIPMDERQVDILDPKSNFKQSFPIQEGKTIGDFLKENGKSLFCIFSESGYTFDDNTPCSALLYAGRLRFEKRLFYYRTLNSDISLKSRSFSIGHHTLRSFFRSEHFVAYHNDSEVSIDDELRATDLCSFNKENPLKIFNFPGSFTYPAEIGSRSFQATAIINDINLIDDANYFGERICDALAESFKCNPIGLRNFLNKNPPKVNNLFDLSLYKFTLTLPRLVSLPIVPQNHLQTKDEKVLEILVGDEDLQKNSVKLNIDTISAKLETALKKEFGENIDIRKVKESLPADFFMLLLHSFDISQISFILVEQIDPRLSTEEAASARNHYLEVAKKYNKDPANRHSCITEFDGLCRKLQKGAETYRSRLLTPDLFSMIESLPYISIVGPAGLGKTQFFYILQAIFPNCFVRLLVDKELYTYAQPINMENSRLSLMFVDLCGEEAVLFEKIFRGELAELAQSCRAFAHSSVCDKPLKSIGFVVALLSIVAKSKYAVDYLGYSSEQDIPSLEKLTEFRYREMSFREAIFHLSQFDKIPCIFLDEFNLSNHKARLAYMRNLLRALGVVCVTLGTDSRASNLIDHDMLGNFSSSIANAAVWVYVWTRLPKMTFETLSKSEELTALRAKLPQDWRWTKFFDWFQTIPSSNCRLICFAAEEIIKYCSQDGFLKKPFHQFFSHILHEVRDRLEVIKMLVGKESKLFAKIGAVATNFIYWREDFKDATKKESIPSELIHSHYALLDFPPEATVEIKKKHHFSLVRFECDETIQLKHTEKSNPWTPISIYPEVEGNELYFLTLECSRDPDDGQYFRNKPSIVVFWEYFKTIFRNNPDHVNINNAFKHSGSSFENVGHWIFMAASRMEKGSLAGTNLKDFIKHLIKLYDFRKKRQYKIKNNPYFRKISSKIPYLGPMDSTFSEAFMAIEGILVRFLESTKDSEKIDGRLVRKLAEDIYCVLEFKNWDKNVTVANIIEIVLKAYDTEFKKNDNPNIPEILFLFVRTFSEIGKNTKFEKLEELRKTRNIVFLKLSTSPESRNDSEVEVIVSQRVLEGDKSDPPKPTIYVILFSLTALFGSDYSTRLQDNLDKYIEDNEYDPIIEPHPEDDDDETLSIPEDIQVPAKRRADEETTDLEAHVIDDSLAGTM